jgi:hypothetical protein
LARSLQSIWHGPIVGFASQFSKGIWEMFASFASARETATIFAGALVTALMFVSAATSLPIA